MMPRGTGTGRRSGTAWPVPAAPPAACTTPSRNAAGADRSTIFRPLWSNGRTGLPPYRRVATAHCCAASPSDPYVPLVAAYGSSKPGGRFRRRGVLGPCGRRLSGAGSASERGGRLNRTTVCSVRSGTRPRIPADCGAPTARRRSCRAGRHSADPLGLAQNQTPSGEAAAVAADRRRFRPCHRPDQPLHGGIPRRSGTGPRRARKRRPRTPDARLQPDRSTRRAQKKASHAPHGDHGIDCVGRRIRYSACQAVEGVSTGHPSVTSCT